MSQTNSRALARNTYSLDTVGVLAHLRDTTLVYVQRLSTRLAAPRGGDEVSSLPHVHVGPARDLIERHSITDAWRIR